MTDIDYLLLYAYIKTEDHELRNALYHNRLDEALNILLVEISQRNIHFKNLTRGYGIRPDHVIEETLSHLVEHVVKYRPYKCASKPHTMLRGYITTIVRGYWCDMFARTRNERKNFNRSDYE